LTTGKPSSTLQRPRCSAEAAAVLADFQPPAGGDGGVVTGYAMFAPDADAETHAGALSSTPPLAASQLLLHPQDTQSPACTSACCP
jgi:hypothetical protein